MNGENSDSFLQTILVRFETKHLQYKVVIDPIKVPSLSVTENLNNILNKILKESNPLHENIEFDFLCCSEYIRTSLIDHIKDRKISNDEIVNIEFVIKYPSPEPQDCLIHDDWVSAVALHDKWVLTGCYDNTLHLWTCKGKHHLTIPGHTSPIKAVAWISLDEDHGTFVSASQDNTAIIWKWNIPRNSVDFVYVCKGHTKGLETVAVNDDSTILATGSWDCTIKFWSLKKEEENEKICLEPVKTECSETKVPFHTLQGHKEPITGIAWSEKSEIITSSRDCTLKLWDIELEKFKHEIRGNKCFFDIDYSAASKLIITASADKNIHSYDPRLSDCAALKLTFSSHTQWVQCVKWSKTEENFFISGAYDNSLLLWDTRSCKSPLFDLTSHEDKVLSCDWSNPSLIVSGGADNTVRIFNSKSSR